MLRGFNYKPWLLWNEKLYDDKVRSDSTTFSKNQGMYILPLVIYTSHQIVHRMKTCAHDTVACHYNVNIIYIILFNFIIITMQSSRKAFLTTISEKHRQFSPTTRLSTSARNFPNWAWNPWNLSFRYMLFHEN